MTAITDEVKIIPWYKQGWPWFLMALPATAVVAGFITYAIASSTWDGLVVDDYDKEGREINKTVDRTRLAAALGLVSEFNVDPQGHVTLTVSAKDAVNVPQKVIVTIAHPTQAGRDQILFLVAKTAGEFEGTALPLTNGRWLLQIEDESRQWRMNGVVHLPAEAKMVINAADL